MLILDLRKRIKMEDFLCNLWFFGENEEFVFW